jgi:hypothetical protein
MQVQKALKNKLQRHHEIININYAENWYNTGLRYTYVPNIVVEWLTLLLRIREVSGLNLDFEAGYPEVFMSFFSPSLQIRGL